MSVYQSIKNSLVAELKALYPNFDVFSEEISKTDSDNAESDIENYFFIDIVPVSNQTFSEYHTQRSLVIDIAGHTEKESNEEYLNMAEAIDHKIRPVFHFGDRAITIHNSKSSIVDKVMHYTFELSFMDTVHEIADGTLMGELDISTNERA